MKLTMHARGKTIKCRIPADQVRRMIRQSPAYLLPDNKRMIMSKRIVVIVDSDDNVVTVYRRRRCPLTRRLRKDPQGRKYV